MSDSAAVTVRYWAGARAAAGVETETFYVEDVAGVKAAAVQAHPDLAEVLPRCSILVDGRRGEDADPLRAGASVEVLPPFAGG